MEKAMQPLLERELHFNQFATQVLLPFAERFPLHYLTGNKGIRLAYRHFQHPKPADNLLILINGRAENLLKWTEIAFDFYQLGYDILVFDHRGQGYSDRLLTDKEKGYIDQFRFYVDDLDCLIQHIVNQNSYKHQYLIAHSMGGLIATFYLANYPHHIDKAVLSAPLFGLPRKHLWRDKLLVALLILLGQSQSYVFGYGAYRPANLHKNHLSYCKTRIKWHNRIYQAFPQLRIGGPTFAWLHQIFNAFNRLPQKIKQVEIPLLILEAGQDKVVSNTKIEQFSSLFRQAKLYKLPKAQHEILFEKDPIREKALQSIQHFFTQ
ncbi:lysophospholipase [Mergibacter septicus]|uniref:Lysophospholipase n=2 Tax=Mergibacter septicus TaxID=221402 RepID=A0A8E3S9C2_9PAST|nr:lysophospholipase [Mergibacter septicus]QDJ13626.1 lysophospholipase [Mergibacter septicus]QDJ15422.1 lysophospholipase [Mergibacter septicus]UTU48706.1 alpha/beta fold hydrolase [Mergibacter septicus]